MNEVGEGTQEEQDEDVQEYTCIAAYQSTFFYDKPSAETEGDRHKRMCQSTVDLVCGLVCLGAKQEDATQAGTASYVENMNNAWGTTTPWTPSECGDFNDVQCPYEEGACAADLDLAIAE